MSRVSFDVLSGVNPRQRSDKEQQREKEQQQGERAEDGKDDPDDDEEEDDDGGGGRGGQGEEDGATASERGEAGDAQEFSDRATVELMVGWGLCGRQRFHIGPSKCHFVTSRQVDGLFSWPASGRDTEGYRSTQPCVLYAQASLFAFEVSRRRMRVMFAVCHPHVGLYPVCPVELGATKCAMLLWYLVSQKPILTDVKRAHTSLQP